MNRVRLVQRMAFVAERANKMQTTRYLVWDNRVDWTREEYRDAGGETEGDPRPDGFVEGRNSKIYPGRVLLPDELQIDTSYVLDMEVGPPHAVARTFPKTLVWHTSSSIFPKPTFTIVCFRSITFLQHRDSGSISRSGAGGCGGGHNGSDARQ